MMTFDYVASGSAVPDNILGIEQREEIKQALIQSTAILQLRLVDNCKNVKPTVSGMFNAWTEANLVDVFKYLENCNFRSTYADSGGLQIVTADKAITEEVKDRVYEVQCYADYAMCFDDIPLESDGPHRNRNERSNLFNKIFMRNKHAVAAQLTATNIKRQIEIFRKHSTRSKVFLIAHGNNARDMLDYYRAVAEVLTDDDYKYVGGLALSKMCIGTGDLENIEMMKGARLISNECHPTVSKHLHILGAGSLERLRPAIYLLRSGYLNKFETFSTDSSSHTSSFNYGLLKTNGHSVPLGQYRTVEGEKHFLDVYDMFAPALQKLAARDKFLSYIFSDGQYNHYASEWSYSAIRERALASQNDRQIIVAHIIKALHTYFQIDNFVMNIDKIWGEPLADSRKHKPYLSGLLKVKDDGDMAEWHSYFSHYVESKRVKTTKRANVEFC